MELVSQESSQDSKLFLHKKNLKSEMLRVAHPQPPNWEPLHTFQNLDFKDFWTTLGQSLWYLPAPPAQPGNSHAHPGVRNSPRGQQSMAPGHRAWEKPHSCPHTQDYTRRDNTPSHKQCSITLGRVLHPKHSHKPRRLLNSTQMHPLLCKDPS